MSGITLAGGTPEIPPDPGTGRALKLQTDAPHLVSMGGDRLSTSVTLHPIPPGRVTLGSGPGVDIPVQGTGVSSLHCHIENSEGVVTLYPLSENLCIDGMKVNGPTRLSQGVMITIGRSNYMRFNHPAEAKLMKSVLPNPRISMAPINFEPTFDIQTKFNKKPPVVPKKSPRGSLSDSGSEELPPSNIMTKVSKFEYLAAQNLKKSYSPKVFTSNVPTVNVPVKDVLGKDIESLRKSLPQSTINYVELHQIEKQPSKISNPNCIFAKQPQYVNVAVNEMKNINNRVVIYENGCSLQKTAATTFNYDHNELQQKKSSLKNVNLSRSSSNSNQYFNRSVTPNPVSSNNIKIEHRRSGSVGAIPVNNTNYNNSNSVEELEIFKLRNQESEIKRHQAQKERIKEQEIGKAEKQRLEEILNMCAEYEKQSQMQQQQQQQQNEKTKPPLPNRIITNGSLPRDKRHNLGPPSPFGSPPPSPLEILHNELLKHGSSSNNQHSFHHHNYENVIINNSEPLSWTVKGTESQYENISTTGSYPSSPRTRIKTFIGPTKDMSSESIIENKFAVLETERKLLKEAEKVLRQNLHNSREIKEEHFDFLDLSSLPPPPAPAPATLTQPQPDDSFLNNNTIRSVKEPIKYRIRVEDEIDENKKRLDNLRKEKRDILTVICRIKRQMAEIEIQETELHREIELEKALITGEYKSKQLELVKIETRKEKLIAKSHKIEIKMKDCQSKQEKDQEECKRKLDLAQQHMNSIEEKLKLTDKNTDEFEEIFEKYLQAQEQLDNERKNFEDLEFHHLEEEADWLASREEIQREIHELSIIIDNLNLTINELENQKEKTLNTNMNDCRTIEKQKNECMARLEEIRERLKSVEYELSLYNTNNDESEQEFSTDSSDDSDKMKMSVKTESPSPLSVHQIQDLSHSLIIIDKNKSKLFDEECSMSQSFNEKLLHEKSILEDASDKSGDKNYPSQHDIDRISKVTLDAPIIGEDDGDNGSLGRKTIEVLKELERNRHLHLCQQGSQVIEEERQRVQALKQKVQEEVKSQWAQQKHDSLASTTESDGTRISSSADTEDKQSYKLTNSDEIRNSKEENDSGGSCSPRPLSIVSDTSVEVGAASASAFINKKRNKVSDKQRPLTRYLPIRSADLDLRNHIESAGHQVVLCPHVLINSTSCRGFLHKKGSKLNGWSRRWFVFDRSKRTFTYFTDKNEKKTRGGAYFQAIEEVYIDHLNTIKSPNPQLNFIVKTHERLYYLMAPSPEAMRIWVDVIFTGAEGNREFEHGT